MKGSSSLNFSAPGSEGQLNKMILYLLVCSSLSQTPPSHQLSDRAEPLWVTLLQRRKLVLRLWKPSVGSIKAAGFLDNVADFTLKNLSFFLNSTSLLSSHSDDVEARKNFEELALSSA